MLCNKSSVKVRGVNKTCPANYFLKSMTGISFLKLCWALYYCEISNWLMYTTTIFTVFHCFIINFYFHLGLCTVVLPFSRGNTIINRWYNNLMDTVSYSGPAQCKDFASLHKDRSVFIFLGSTSHLH